MTASMGEPRVQPAPPTALKTYVRPSGSFNPLPRLPHRKTRPIHIPRRARNLEISKGPKPPIKSPISLPDAVVRTVAGNAFKTLTVHLSFNVSS